MSALTTCCSHGFCNERGHCPCIVGRSWCRCWTHMLWGHLLCWSLVSSSKITRVYIKRCAGTGRVALKESYWTQSIPTIGKTVVSGDGPRTTHNSSLCCTLSLILSDSDNWAPLGVSKWISLLRSKTGLRLPCSTI